jgi:formate dehydrogenase gamma subunit
MEERVIERFKKRTIWLHWIHTAAFLILVITGAILFIPGLGAPAAGGITRLLHRIAVVFFVVIPIVYVFIDPRAAWSFVKECFVWGTDDIKWVTKAPDYYFGGKEEKMLPQGHINTGQKMWQLVVVSTSAVFVLTGIIMWFLKGAIALELFQWCVILHDIAFVVVFFMLLVHVYLGTIHPRMTESFRSMIDGKISKKYARSHYAKWYEKNAATDKG